MPCLHCPSVETIEASASMRAVWAKNEAGCSEYTFSRARLIASCSAMIEASSKRRQKSPAVVGSGSDGVPRPSKNTASVAAGLDVLQAPAAAQCVVGDVQHVVGLVVGAVDLEQSEGGVDLAGQADRLDQAGDHPDATMRDPPVALGPLVADRGSLKQRAGQVRAHRRSQPPLDRQLFALEPALQLSLRLAHLTLPVTYTLTQTIA